MHVVFLATAQSCSECVTHLVSPIKIIFTVPILQRKETAHTECICFRTVTLNIKRQHTLYL